MSRKKTPQAAKAHKPTDREIPQRSSKVNHAEEKRQHGPSRQIQDLLEIAAWAQVWRVDIYEFLENYGKVLSFDRLIPLDSNHRALTTCLSAAKQRHARLYASLLKRAEAFSQAVHEQHGAYDGQKIDFGALYMPPHVLDWMWRVAQNVATRCVPIYKVIRELHIPAESFFDQIKRKNPLAWREVWNYLGLGWPGKRGAAPQELLTRARMRKGANMCVLGFTMAYASRQMGLSSNAVSGLKYLYPEYWEFLCREIRGEVGLSAGQNLAAQVIDKRGQVIVGVPRGMGRVARKTLRKSHGLKRPSYGHLLGSDTRAKVATGPKQPHKTAIEAYRLAVIAGHSQTETAQMLSSEHKRKIVQGTVNRWIGRVKKFIEAGGVLPSLDTGAAKPRVTSQDPRKLDYLDKADGRSRLRKSPLQRNSI